MNKNYLALGACTALALVLASNPALAQTATAYDIGDAEDAKDKILLTLTAVGALITAIMVGALGMKMAPWAISKVSRLFNVGGRA